MFHPNAANPTIMSFSTDADFNQGLSDLGFADEQQIPESLLKPCHRIEETLAELAAEAGAPPTICVMPEGPLTSPYVAG